MDNDHPATGEQAGERASERAGPQDSQSAALSFRKVAPATIYAQGPLHGDDEEDVCFKDSGDSPNCRIWLSDRVSA